jgi:hypothetical protein
MQCKTMHFLVVWNSFWIVYNWVEQFYGPNESQPSNDIYIFQNFQKFTNCIFFGLDGPYLVWTIFILPDCTKSNLKGIHLFSYFYVLYIHTTQCIIFFEVIMIFFWKLIKLIFFVRFKSTYIINEWRFKKIDVQHIWAWQNRCLVRGGFRGGGNPGRGKSLKTDFPY